MTSSSGARARQVGRREHTPDLRLPALEEGVEDLVQDDAPLARGQADLVVRFLVEPQHVPREIANGHCAYSTAPTLCVRGRCGSAVP